jgi:hypothetical protein
MDASAKSLDCKDQSLKMRRPNAPRKLQLQSSIQSLDSHDIGLIARGMPADCWVPYSAEAGPAGRHSALASVDDGANRLVGQLLNGPNVVCDIGWSSADGGIPGVVDFYPTQGY